MAGTVPERKIGNGGIDLAPLAPLRNRPRVALSVVILRELSARRIQVHPVNPIKFEDVADFPPAWLTALSSCGLLDRRP